MENDVKMINIETVTGQSLKMQILETIDTVEQDSDKTIDQQLDYLRTVIAELMRFIPEASLSKLKTHIDKL